MSETSIDVRSVLEKQYGVAPRSNLNGRVGGPAPRSNIETPRANIATVKDLAMF